MNPVGVSLSHLWTPPISPGFRQHGRLSSWFLSPVHLISPVHASAHHSGQPQGLNILHGAGERDRPLPPPLPSPAQVASALRSTHCNLHLLFLLPRAFRSGLIFQLCVFICTVVMFDGAFIYKTMQSD